MKLPFGKELSPPILVSSILLIVCGIFTIWLGCRVIAIIPLHEGLIALGDVLGLIDLVAGFLLLLSGYYMLKLDNVETGAILSLLLGLIFTIWYYMVGTIGIIALFEGIIPLIAALLALTQLKPITKTLWRRRFKGFWLDFSHSKIGLFGLGIVLLYVAVAFLQPTLATNDPEEKGLAYKYAMPEWIAIVDPKLQNLPRTTYYILGWNWTSLPEGATIQHSDDKWIIRYEGDESVVVHLYKKFSYLYDPPKSFRYSFRWGAKPGFIDGEATARYSLELKLTTPDGKTYPIWDQHWGRYHRGTCPLENPDWKPGGKEPYRYPGSTDYMLASQGGKVPGYNVYEKYGWEIPIWETEESDKLVVYTAIQEVSWRLGYKPWRTKEMAYDLFSPPGENHTLQWYITIKPTQQNASCQVTITDFEIRVPGLLWGLLGTEEYGRDCWSRLVYGARVSLGVGIACAVVSTVLGITVGVSAGYIGGLVDETLMRVVDILLCLPLLPILMVLIFFLGPNILYIILFIAIFGWLGLARMVRSQILSLREMPFVECARAAGAPTSEIMLRHLVPNVMPIVLTDFVLSIPGAILLEAALSFIGFGDPSTPTWGREFSIMQHVGGIPLHAWWWMIPPGLAITILCVGFVFLGHAVDEIVNPKLRRRR